MLRTLLQKKEKQRAIMSALWKQKETKEWSKEQRTKYDEAMSEAKRLDSTIKERSDYVEMFQERESNKPEVREMNKLKKHASVYNILRSQVFEATGDARFKVDSGPIREIVQEREKRIDSQYVKTGEVPVPIGDFALKKRATISTATGSAEDLKQETIYSSLVENLYAKSWSGRIGATVVENWRGDFILSGEKDEPQSGFISELSDYPESSIDYEKVTTLRPLKVGALQPFSLQSLMQDETMDLQNSINSQLMKEFAKKVDTDFLYGDGTAPNPQGITGITGVLTASTDGADGGALSFTDCISSEGKLTEENQDSPPVWIVNSKTVTHARSTLRNNVAGSLYIGNTKQLADRRFVQSNVVKSNLTKGSSGTTLSEALLVVPSSVIIVNWAMPVISIDRSLGFKNDVVWTKISAYLNIGLKRPKDLVRLQNIKTS